ncbi:hypothetical protein TNCV_134971 [Trichonephila clavipes]|nr:hypothetical protein TNCV_134971 [Trichonephila clavipes]
MGLLLNGIKSNLGKSRFNLDSDDNRKRAWGSSGGRLNPALACSAIHSSHNLCDGKGCHYIRHTVICNINPRHHDSPEVCSLHSSSTCVATHGRTPSRDVATRVSAVSMIRGPNMCNNSTTKMPFVSKMGPRKRFNTGLNQN